MKRASILSLVAWIAGGTAWAQGIDPGMVGSWAGVEFPMTFQVQPSGMCSVMAMQGTCATGRGNLTFTSQAGEWADYRYTIKKGLLTITSADLPQPMVFRKDAGSSQPPSPAAVGYAPQPQQAPAPAELPATTAAPAGPGTPWSKESWGVRLTIPAGWKGGEKDGVLYLGGEHEAGLIVVRFSRQSSREAVLAEYQRGVQENGVSLMPTSPAQDFRGHSARGLAGELAGQGVDGTRYRARGITLLSPQNDALVVFGITTPEQYTPLKAHVEAVAKSVVMTAPVVPKGGQVLAGHYEYVYVSPTGGYTREAKITLCADGRFNKGGEMSGGGDRWGAATNHNNGGRWSSVGDGMQGSITLTYNNGQSETLNYRVSQDPRDRSAYGAGMVIGPTKYQKTGTGDCR